MAKLTLIAKNENIPQDKRQIFYWIVMTPEMEKMMFKEQMIKTVKFVDALKYCKLKRWHKLAYEIRALRQNFSDKKFDEVKIKFQDMLKEGEDHV